MSFDLILEAESKERADRVREETLSLVRALPKIRFAEVLPLSEARVCSVGFPAKTRDAVVATVYQGLVQVAGRQGLQLTDPQAGVAVDLAQPYLYPPGWEPLPPEEAERAGNRRALFACGGILLVVLVLISIGYWSIRGVFGDEVGEVCHSAMDCRWGLKCVRALGAQEPRCQLECDKNADCLSRRCVSVYLEGSRTRSKVCAPAGS